MNFWTGINRQEVLQTIFSENGYVLTRSIDSGCSRPVFCNKRLISDTDSWSTDMKNYLVNFIPFCGKENVLGYSRTNHQQVHYGAAIVFTIQEAD